MNFTPSYTSSFTASAAFWSILWATLGKLDETVCFLGFKNKRPRKAIVRWTHTCEMVAPLGMEAFNSRWTRWIFTK